MEEVIATVAGTVSPLKEGMATTITTVAAKVVTWRIEATMTTGRTTTPLMTSKEASDHPDDDLGVYCTLHFCFQKYAAEQGFGPQADFANRPESQWLPGSTVLFYP